MKKWIIGVVVVLFLIGCTTVPHKADLLVRYPVEGEVVWMSPDGSFKRAPYFIIDEEKLKKYFDEKKGY